MEDSIEVTAFTDGAAKGNPGRGGWGAVLLVGGAAVRELGGAGGHTTNNRMEMTAALEALEWRIAAAHGGSARITLVTDSTYVLRGVTEWVKGWKKRGWKTAAGGDVANRDLWERLDAAASACASVTWRYVPGHAGFPGNERADVIASEFALGREVPLYAGPYEGYGHDLDHLPESGSPMRSVSKSASRGGARQGRAVSKAGAVAAEPPARNPTKNPARGSAHSYVSLVDGVLLRHSTWAECERRVKGRSNARFRKTSNAADEAALVAAWGNSPASPTRGRKED
jgi:ribonuclease HI